MYIYIYTSDLGDVYRMLVIDILPITSELASLTSEFASLTSEPASFARRRRGWPSAAPTHYTTPCVFQGWVGGSPY